jgi:hypothetical protein
LGKDSAEREPARRRQSCGGKNLRRSAGRGSLAGKRASAIRDGTRAQCAFWQWTERYGEFHGWRCLCRLGEESSPRHPRVEVDWAGRGVFCRCAGGFGGGGDPSASCASCRENGELRFSACSSFSPALLRVRVFPRRTGAVGLGWWRDSRKARFTASRGCGSISSAPA